MHNPLLANRRLCKARACPAVAYVTVATPSISSASVALMCGAVFHLSLQALLSLVDLVYHGQALPSAAGGTSSVWSSLAAQHASLPPPAGTCPQVRDQHTTHAQQISAWLCGHGCFA